jgi:RNA recognition motif-containing protein
MGNRLYIGNLSFKATEENIRDLFAGIGEVVSIDLVTDARTKKPKGFAFLVMASDGEAQKAIEALNGTLLLDRPLSVSEANTQQPRERRDLDSGSGRRREGILAYRKTMNRPISRSVRPCRSRARDPSGRPS